MLYLYLYHSLSNKIHKLKKKKVVDNVQPKFSARTGEYKAVTELQRKKKTSLPHKL